ncbi:hypothetical protein L218DRAFT_956404 [Marasmius fiardii PR-910]|nr:hypothetical protein L218DRAFT_956404 [Marasmius fiardii PR-910]
MTSQLELHEHPRSLHSMPRNSNINSTATHPAKIFRASAGTLTSRVASLNGGDEIGTGPTSSSVTGISGQEQGGGRFHDGDQSYPTEDRLREEQAQEITASTDVILDEPKSSLAIRGNGYQPPPSAFNRVPLSHLDTSGSTNIRDSLLTQSSYLSQPTITSSSIYPQSSSSEANLSRTNSMVSQQEEERNDSPPVIDGYQEYKGDDVAYRLRLLVNNNYFLPPAHAKPKPSDFSTKQVPISKKPPTPTNSFLDLFRKPKSKPSTPTTPEYPTPILRTTSDSTTASAYGISQPRTPTHPPRSPALNSDVSDRLGRVVVVREKMEDLAIAAKQAEQEMKERGLRQDPAEPIDNVIDPTDSVDVPLPGSGYPFAVQTSTAHGLGVEESVGAAQLADRLPPNSPDSSFQAENDWRKALLKAAVGHSFEQIDTTHPSMQSPPTSGTTSPVSVRKIGLQIISNPILLDSSNGASLSSSPLPQSSPSPRTPLSPSAPPTPLRSFSGATHELPERVETPSTPLRPLQPPPRRQVINPIYSLSQTDLPASSSRSSQERRPPSSSSIRKTSSSPMLPNVHESPIRPGMTMTPPPLNIQKAHSSLSNRVPSSSAGSIYSINDDYSRVSTSTSRSQNGPRGDNHPSPSTSAFQDALSRPPSLRGSSQSRVGGDENGLNREDYRAASPPPRSSTLSAHRPLLPPSSFQLRQYTLHKSYSEDGHGTRGRERRISISSAQTAPLPEIEIFAPEPTTPPLPVSEHRDPHPLRISIPIDAPPTSIHSAPPHPSFFDSIQSELSSLEDLDSSSDESEEDDVDHGPFEPPRRPFIDHPLPSRSITPQPRASGSRTPIMRLGNYSTPHVSRTTEERRDVLDSKHAVGHTASRQPTFFTDRSPLTSTYELYQYAGSTSDLHRHSGSSAALPLPRRATMEDQIIAKFDQNRKRDQESLKRLDGLLKQHMEDEKDRIRKITSNSRINHTLSQPP